ncbi:MAG: hypothetical protein WCF67_00465 [Chitinophagaceae bacterium]
MDDNKRKDSSLGQESNQNWDDQNDQRTSGSKEPNPERLSKEGTGREDTSGQESNQDWDDQNDKPASGKHEPNPQRFTGSAFNEDKTATGYGSSQRSERDNVGPLDADLNDLTSEKRNSGNQTGPGLG